MRPNTFAIFQHCVDIYGVENVQAFLEDMATISNSDLSDLLSSTLAPLAKWKTIASKTPAQESTEAS